MTGMSGTPVDLEKLRSIGYLSRGRTQSRSKSGREHPESGEPYKATRDELGNVVTEHGAAGSGCSDRQDVNIHAETVHYDMRERQ
jgi:hypothetical protein